MGLRVGKQGKNGPQNSAESLVTVRAIQTQTPGRAFAGMIALGCCVLAGAAITVLAQPNEGGMPFFPVSSAVANAVPPTMVSAANSNDSLSVASLNDEINDRIAGSLPPLIREAFDSRAANALTRKYGSHAASEALGPVAVPVAGPAVMPAAAAPKETAEAMRPVLPPIGALPAAL